MSVFLFLQLVCQTNIFHLIWFGKKPSRAFTPNMITTIWLLAAAAAADDLRQCSSLTLGYEKRERLRGRIGKVWWEGRQSGQQWLADGDRTLTATMPWHRKRKCCCHHIDMTTNALRSSWDCSKWHSIYLPAAPPYPSYPPITRSSLLLTGKCN